MAQFLCPASFFLDDDAKSVWLQIAVGAHSEGVPLKRWDAWHVDEQYAQWVVMQTFKTRLESKLATDSQVSAVVNKKVGSGILTWILGEVQLDCFGWQKASRDQPDLIPWLQESQEPIYHEEVDPGKN